jgi:hypothetical protein
MTTVPRSLSPPVVLTLLLLLLLLLTLMVLRRELGTETKQGLRQATHHRR